MAASTKGGMGQDVDLDLFLTAIESKLRGPFSSLDLTKTVTTAALRGNNVSEVQYLQQIAQVLNKSEKIIQMRVLIGLLGLDPEPEMNEVIFSLLRQAQGKGEDTMDREDLTEEEKLAQRYEEWVRVVSGLIQGVMYKKDDNDETKNYGEEAQGLLDATCDEVMKQIEKLAQQVERQQEEEEDDEEKTSSDIDTSLKAADVDPMMAPYRFSLLNPKMLKDSLPEALEPNPHFAVNEDVDVLNMDAKQEEIKAQEEADYALQKQQVIQKAGATSSQRTSAPERRVVMPGQGSGSNMAAKKKAAARPKSSLFITRKPPAASAAAKRTGLHVRKKGAAMGLVGKGRQLQGTAGVSGVGGGAMRLGGGRALKASAHSGGAPRSKMKMIDVSEAADLAKQQQETPAIKDRTKKLTSLKRKAPGAAGRPTANKTARLGNSAVAASKSNALSQDSKPAASAPAGQKEAPEPSGESANALAAAALTKYQTQMAGETNEQNRNGSAQDSTASALAAAALTKYRTQTSDTAQNQPPQQRRPSQPRQLNWQQLLQDKSNKLTDDDRDRVRLFFENRTNPSPGESVVKMKLHEERSTDPETGQPVKETYYLELNYNTFTSKQSKKVKRYS